MRSWPVVLNRTRISNEWTRSPRRARQIGHSAKGIGRSSRSEDVEEIGHLRYRGDIGRVPILFAFDAVGHNRVTFAVAT